ncbi:hypothetical protein C8Q80DRAFT_1123197 [Daedaleopsis nitida]|nr:hypothetical protein C8Q80DRAFT_1123197 [Daedaleopsis nitida]
MNIKIDFTEAQKSTHTNIVRPLGHLQLPHLRSLTLGFRSMGTFHPVFFHRNALRALRVTLQLEHLHLYRVMFTNPRTLPSSLKLSLTSLAGDVLKHLTFEICPQYYLAVTELPIFTRLQTLVLKLFNFYQSDFDRGAEPSDLVSLISDNLHKISSTCSHYIFVLVDQYLITDSMLRTSWLTSKSESAEINRLLRKEGFNFFLQALLHSMDDLSSKVTVCISDPLALTRNRQDMLTERLCKVVPRLDDKGLFEVAHHSALSSTQIQYGHSVGHIGTSLLSVSPDRRWVATEDKFYDENRMGRRLLYCHGFLLPNQLLPGSNTI